MRDQAVKPQPAIVEKWIRYAQLKARQRSGEFLAPDEFGFVKAMDQIKNSRRVNNMFFKKPKPQLAIGGYCSANK